jgi:hypothetical protein
VTIAHQEDAKRYKAPVTFYNEQLMPLIGVTKWETLDNARKRAEKAGWLYYEPGNRGQRLPGRYWVTIPTELDDLADNPCDETQYPTNGERDESQSPLQYPTKGEREGEHSTLYLNLNTCAETPKASSTPEPAVLTFPTDGNPKSWNLTQSTIDRFKELYPSLDIMTECRKSLAWIEADSKRRKTAGGMKRFLTNWLNNNQNSYRGNGNSQTATDAKPPAPLKLFETSKK